MLLTWNLHHVKFISNINARQYMVKPSNTKTKQYDRKTDRYTKRKKYDPQLSMSGN